MRKRIFTAGCIFALALMTTGCGDKSSEGTTSDAPTTAVESGATVATDSTSETPDADKPTESVEPAEPADIQTLLDAAVVKGANTDDPALVEAYQNDALGIGLVDGMEDGYRYFDTRCISGTLADVNKFYGLLQTGDWQGAFDLCYPDGLQNATFITPDDFKNTYSSLGLDEATDFKYILDRHDYRGNNEGHWVYKKGSVDVSYGTGVLNIGWHYYNGKFFVYSGVPMIDGKLKLTDGDNGFYNWAENGISVKIDGVECSGSFDAEWNYVFQIAERPEYTVVVTKDGKNHTFTVSLEELKASEEDGCLTLDISKAE